jgi:nucleoside-diphosphate-sugar epimerase
MSSGRTGKGLVLVTGGTGFVAGHVIQQLLERGYSVRTTVRDLSSRAEYAHLYGVAKAIARSATPGGVAGEDREVTSSLSNLESFGLDVVQADLTVPSSWEAAFAGGVEAVVHVASPHLLKPADPEKSLMEPAAAGTKTILEYCQNTESVKRLVFTSCLSALTDDFNPAHIYDEEDWNSTSTLTRNSYAYSKTVAERTAWTFSRRPDCTFSLVCCMTVTKMQ